MLTKLFLLIVSLFFTVSSFSQDDHLYKISTIPEELTANANGIVRLNDFNVTIDSQNKVTFVIKRITTVLNEFGNSYVGAYAGYDKTRKIKKIQATVFDQNGNQIKKIRQGDFIDHSAVDGGTLYSDSRVLYMSYIPVQYPYTVEFICEMETENTAFVPSWNPIESYFMGIEQSTYHIVDNANLGLRFKERNFGEYPVKSSKTNRELLYSISNIKAIKPEELGPSLKSIAPSVMCATNKFHYSGFDGEASNWKEFGDWMHHSLLKGRDEVSQKTKDDILALTQGIEDPLKRASLVYKYVQNTTRYISVQVGIGGIQPIAASEVDQLKYGDCKGLTNYTQALLKIADVESYYTIVQSGAEIEGFDDEFASLEQGDHIILGIPNGEDTVWVDCTSQYNPFGFIGDFTDDRNVLSIKPDGSHIIKTTNYVNDSNYQYTEAEVSISEDASLKADIVILTSGIQYDHRVHIERESNEKLIEYYRNYWNYINNLNVDSYEFKNDKETVEFSETLQLNSASYATATNGQILFSPNVFNRNTYIPDRYRNRTLPLVIPRGYLDKDHYVFTIPEGYIIEGMPKDVKLENKFGYYSITTQLIDDKLVFDKELLIKKGTYPKTDYESYRQFRKDVSKYDKSMVVLKTQI